MFREYGQEFLPGNAWWKWSSEKVPVLSFMSCVTEQAYHIHEQDLKGCIKVHLVFVETGSP